MINCLPLIVIGGFHSTDLTSSFVSSLSPVINSYSFNPVIIPHPPIIPYDAIGYYQYLIHHFPPLNPSSPLIIMAFSAGVVGAIALARKWQRQGGIIHSLWAFDGWGVPLYGDFPRYRISHDFFTHVTNFPLECCNDNFYGNPSVSHLDLWRSPHLLQGYSDKSKEKISLIEFMIKYLK